ncbi:hypothetical protein ACQP2U_34345 [Nocardia sp. CA-084685]
MTADLGGVGVGSDLFAAGVVFEWSMCVRRWGGGAVAAPVYRVLYAS